MDYDMDGQSLIPGRRVRGLLLSPTLPRAALRPSQHTSREIRLNGTISWDKGTWILKIVTFSLEVRNA
jgi:hypothetical protein